MDLHVEAHSPTPIRRPGAEPLASVIDGGDFPRGSALPSIRELAGLLGIQPKPVVRAIEDLKRSGYRPLRSRLAGPGPWSILGTPPGTARHAGDGEAGRVVADHPERRKPKEARPEVMADRGATLKRNPDRGHDVKTIRETEPVEERDAAVTTTQAGPAERVGESVPDVCRWPTMAIGGLTMVAAAAALAADPLFHLGPGGHLGRIEVRYWYFRPELKYLTCHACAEGGDRSVIGLEAVVCQHRIPTS